MDVPQFLYPFISMTLSCNYVLIVKNRRHYIEIHILSFSLKKWEDLITLGLSPQMATIAWN